MTHKKLLSLAAACLWSAAALASSSAEQALVASIDSKMAQSLQLLEQVVNINSGTMNFAGVQQVGATFAPHFAAMGFATEWVDGSGFGRAGHFVATYQSATRPDAPKILMIGHLDTVFAKDDSFQRYQQVDDTHIAGPGITDMKGGDVIILAALQALHQQGLLEQLNIKVVMTGDEESSGKPLASSKQALVDAAKWADIALGFEDADGSILTAVTARRGSVGWTLTTKGKAAHSSQIFTEAVGDGAIFELARILNSFREQLKDEPLLSFNPGIIAGGTRVNVQADPANIHTFGKSNVVAQEAVVRGGLRAASPRQLAETQAAMQAIVKQHLAHTDASLVFDEGYPPMQNTPGNEKLLALYSQVSVDLGYAPVTAVNPRNAGAADISFTAGYVDMAIDGLGLMGEGGHTKDEVADITSFKQNIEKTAVLLYRLSLGQHK